MKLNEVHFSGPQPPIDAYAPGGFRISLRPETIDQLNEILGPILQALDYPLDEAQAA